VTSSSKLLKALIYIYYALVPLLPLIAYVVAKNHISEKEKIVLGVLVNIHILINNIVFIYYAKIVCDECMCIEGKRYDLG